jgi:hypothetical protein
MLKSGLNAEQATQVGKLATAGRQAAASSA